MKVLVKIPTRGRGFEWFRKYLYIEGLETQFLISVDSDDKQAVPNWVKDYAYVVQGNSKNKIDAINRDINEFDFDWDILIVGSDDMEPMIRGYDNIAIRDMQKYFPDTDGCLWYNTENSEEELRRRHRKDIPFGSEDFKKNWICMLPVMGRKYYERFGYVYHPAYQSFWCDNEYTEIGRRLKLIQCVNERLFYHQHPSWGASFAPDETYERANVNWNNDCLTFKRRKSHGFPQTVNISRHH